MNFKYIKHIIPGAALVLATAGMSSCTGDLDVTPHDPSTQMNTNEPALFTKCYANMALAGQTGPDGDCDIDGLDGGTTGFVRQLFNTQELPTDEAICCWGDPGVDQFNFGTWDSSHPMINGFYYRLYAGVSYCNKYLQECGGQDAQHTAEVRFLRALYYYYLMDAFGNVPFTTEVSIEAPKQIKRADLFKWLEEELINEVEPNLMDASVTHEGEVGYGRAQKDAAWLLLARMYLNAEVYTGTARWQDAKTYAEKVIAGPHKLWTTPKNGYSAYQMLFMGDNGTNGASQEAVLSLIQDGTTTASYGTTLFLMASTWKSDMNFDKNYGSSEFWAGNRARSNLVKKFFSNGDAPQDSTYKVTTAAGDARALFCGCGTEVKKNDKKSEEASKLAGKEVIVNDTNYVKRTLVAEKWGEYTNGFSVAKYRNTYSDGSIPHNAKFCDTDFFLMRSAEAYFIAAEADARLHGDVTTDCAKYINDIRQRAGVSTQDRWTVNQILDERAREFYFEGYRRTDLIRYGLFNTGEYLWEWKGGTLKGVSFPATHCVFAIPANDIIANPNLKQNEGY